MFSSPTQSRVDLTTADCRFEQRLALARRLDWRFLLPAPQWDEVAYVGSTPDSLLLAALHEHAEHVTVNPATVVGSSDRQRYPLVVCQQPSQEMLLHASGLVQPGGCIYVEIRRPRPWQRRPVKPGQARAVLARCGFAPLSLQWHVPSFDASTQIIPLDDPTPLAWELGQRHSLLAAPVRRTVVRWLLRSRLMFVLTPHVSLIGRLPPSSAGGSSEDAGAKRQGIKA